MRQLILNFNQDSENIIDFSLKIYVVFLIWFGSFDSVHFNFTKMFMTRVALLLTMIAGVPSGFAYAQIHATMETKIGMHGTELNDSKSPPPPPPPIF